MELTIVNLLRTYFDVPNARPTHGYDHDSSKHVNLTRVRHGSVALEPLVDVNGLTRVRLGHIACKPSGEEHPKKTPKQIACTS